jgi:hypothetical protein
MTPRRVHEASLRPDRLEISRLFWAVGVSIALHLLFYGGYELGKKFDIWQAVHLPDWLQKALVLGSGLDEERKQPPPPPQEVSLMFVDVNPQLASAEPPENPKFYSDKSSEAANPEMDQETDMPKITGEHTDVVKAQDVDRSKFDPLQPAIPQAEKEQEPEAARPRTPQPVGDLAIAKPETELRKDQGTAEQARPRTVREALSRQNRNQLVGEKMKQEGGVRRMQVDAGFDVMASPLGNYDLMLVEAVQQRWYDLLDAIKYSFDRHGKVVVSFRLHYDGKITDVQVLENTVDERKEGMLGYLCQKAILDPAPYPRWPTEIRRLIDKDHRDSSFTFNYR